MPFGGGVRVVPRRHQLAPTRRDLLGRDLGRPLPRPRQRCAALGLQRVEAHAGAEPPPGARGERSPADLHDDTVERHAGIGELPADRAPTVEAQRVLGTLHGERHGTRLHGLTEPQHRRVTRRVARAALAVHDGRAEPLDRLRHELVRPVGNVDLDRPVRALGQLGGGDAPRCRTTRWPADAASAPPSAALQRRASGAASSRGGDPCDCRPRLPVSSFTHTLGAELGRQRFRPRERRDGEAGGHFIGQRDARLLRHPVGPGERPPRQARARSATNGFGSSSGAGCGPTSSGCRTWCRSSDVARGQVNGYGVATSTVVPQTAHRQPRNHDITLALNSVISSSHTPR